MMPSTLDVCLRTIDWTERRGFVGYAKGDALNSPLLRAIAGRSRLLRAGCVYGVSRAPVNLRPLLRVEQRDSPKALALFVRAFFVLHALDGDEAWLHRARSLLERLCALSQGHRFGGDCWGAEYPRADPALGAAPYSPGAVITCEVAHAFLDSFERVGDESHLEIARSAARFITDDLRTLQDDPEGLCLSYVPDHDWKVINSNAKTAALLARVGATLGDERLTDRARANMAWVVSKQTSEGAWFYAEPPTASHVTHDNYHTGFVLSSLQEYLVATREPEFRDACEAGLDFYSARLFRADGTPKWRHTQLYPLDIKGAALGILTFSLAARENRSRLATAESIANWAIRNMWRPEGRFMYQRTRLLTRRYTLIRWCQAWPCYALAMLTASREGPSPTG